jgi:hypothetical protein
MHAKTKRQGKSGAIDVNALLREDEEFLRAPVRTAPQEVLEAEMTEALGAEKGERASDRSGYYGRTLITRVGKLELRVPAGPNRAVFDRAVRALSALGAGAGGGAGGDVRARGFDPESEGDHRGAVRPQLFGFLAPI